MSFAFAALTARIAQGAAIAQANRGNNEGAENAASDSSKRARIAINQAVSTGVRNERIQQALAKAPDGSRSQDTRCSGSAVAALRELLHSNSIKCCTKACAALVPHEEILTLRQALESTSTRDARREWITRIILVASQNSEDVCTAIGSHRVCTDFFKRVFGISNKLLYRVMDNVKEELKAARGVPDFLPNSAADTRTQAVNCIPSAFSDGISQKAQALSRRGDDKATHVIAWLKDFSQWHEKMPDSLDIHLPYPDKKSVYERYVEECPQEFVVTYAYFTSIWSSDMQHIKIRKHHRFAICTDCLRITDGLRKTTDYNRRKEFKELQIAHTNIIRREKSEYYRHRDLARKHPEEYISMIIDGADQSNYGLPHFHEKAKSFSGLVQDCKIMGTLAHGRASFIYLCPMNVGSGVNLVIEVLHQNLSNIYFNQCPEKSRLPRTLMLQLDNAPSQNKNNYMMAYLTLLVHWHVFDTIEVNFLPVGHTHEDIDQMFGVLSRHFANRDAITRTDILKECQVAYNQPTPVTGILECQADWVTYLDSLPEFSKMERIKDPLAFKLTKVHGNSDVVCFVKNFVSDDRWLNSLRHGGVVEASSPHRFLPGFSKSPEQVMEEFPVSTSKVVEQEKLTRIAKGLEELKWRIDDIKKYDELQNNIIELGIAKEAPFHWDMAMYGLSYDQSKDADCFRNADYINPGVLGEPMSSDLLYHEGALLVVRCQDTSAPFWLARVTEDVPRDSSEDIEVQWFESCRGLHEKGAYKLAYLGKGRSRAPFYDYISRGTIILSFDSLLDNGHIPGSVLSRIKVVERLF